MEVDKVHKHNNAFVMVVAVVACIVVHVEAVVEDVKIKVS
jgi:hypothetical protein